MFWFLLFLFCRFPVLTWRHPRSRTVLLRASGFHSKSVMGMLKTHSNTHSHTTTATMGTTSPSSKHLSLTYNMLIFDFNVFHAGHHAALATPDVMSTSIEQEKYFKSVADATPKTATCKKSSHAAKNNWPTRRCYVISDVLSYLILAPRDANHRRVTSSPATSSSECWISAQLISILIWMRTLISTSMQI